MYVCMYVCMYECMYVADSPVGEGARWQSRLIKWILRYRVRAPASALALSKEMVVCPRFSMCNPLPVSLWLWIWGLSNLCDDVLCVYVCMYVCSRPFLVNTITSVRLKIFVSNLVQT